MNWTGIACVVFICVTMNHLGLVKAIEERIERELPVIDCVKCCTFWTVLIFTLITSRNLITSLAISFLMSYLALWLELFEGFIDRLYMKLYEKIYPTSDDTPAADADNGNSAGSVSELQENCK